MNVLVVSSYPPMACGIGSYAAQQVASLRNEGATVDVLSPPEGDGDFQINLVAGLRFLKLFKYMWAYDQVYIHYTPAFYFSFTSAISRLATSFAFFTTLLLAGRRMRFVIHEGDHNADDPSINRSGRRLIDRWSWKLAGTILFHSEREREAFSKFFGLSKDRKQLQVVDHGRFFSSYCKLNRPQARNLLQIPEDRVLFLCIGFVQPHKGFDRMVKAMKSVDSDKALLRIVGSVRIEWEPAKRYAARLHEDVATDARCDFIETFVTDELFDAWIVASDYVVAPYREIWSSGVVARAELHGVPVIASSVGGLAEQLPPGSYCFEDDEELAAILSKITAQRDR
ncbi:glycosyltransferase family 4 protein [Candidatus Sumerlaeota bacterium]|nr:glycosyltransferase family 4 protein [Candidatus Sumerlaeota bacterium]